VSSTKRKKTALNWEPVMSPGLASPLAAYVPGARAGNTIYVSGTLAISSDGALIGEGDARAQTRAVIECIRSVLRAAGADLGDIAYNMIFLKNRADYEALNEVYREFFGENPPARYCIVCELVKPEFLVEISSVAHLQN
jgi:aminoacrylate peracid reductase